MPRLDRCWSMDADLPLPLQSPLYIAHEPHATNHCTFYLLSNHHTPRSIDCNQQKIRSLFVWFLDFDLEFDFRFRMASPTRGGRSRQFQFCVSTREATLIKYSIFWIRRMARDSLVVLHFWTRQFWQLHTASVRYRWPKRLSEETKQRKVLLFKITQCVHTSSVAHQRSHFKGCSTVTLQRYVEIRPVSVNCSGGKAEKACEITSECVPKPFEIIWKPFEATSFERRWESALYIETNWNDSNGIGAIAAINRRLTIVLADLTRRIN